MARTSGPENGVPAALRDGPGAPSEAVWEPIQREFLTPEEAATVPSASTAGRSTSISREYRSLLH
jgi:hypothetical protein